jgi:ubiquinone/menaquinone biosynthesis C-methylase UbiE
MIEQTLLERMRSDWNRRAREDAHYYAAFGRHGQNDREFSSTAHEVIYGLEYELKRLPNQANRRSWRALEIGCGPARLMRPLSRHFGEIHGIDVSDEMVRVAREKLRGIPHAHVHVTQDASLSAFADESFDFVYSYAVFQHIPSREVVFSYLREARRVLKTGGLLWFQVNGLPDNPACIDTWSGVRIPAQEIMDFAREHDFQMYTLEGEATQYMWTSLRKRPRGWHVTLPEAPMTSNARILRIYNPYSTEPVVPCEGRLACASVWAQNLPEECGLNHLEVLIEGAPGTPNYISAPLPNGQQQINVLLPPNVRTGLVPLEMRWLGRPLCPPATMRVIPPGPRVPRILAVTDAIDLMSGMRVVNRCVKLTVEEVDEAEEFQIRLDGRPVGDVGVLCAEPRAPRLELNFHLAPDVGAGVHRLEMQVRLRRLPPIEIEVVEGQASTGPA